MKTLMALLIVSVTISAAASEVRGTFTIPYVSGRPETQPFSGHPGWVDGYFPGQKKPVSARVGPDATFILPEPAPVRIVIYDLTGQQVRTLASASFPPGAHAVLWDGRDQRGRDLASGFYLYQLRAGHLTRARKMLLLR